MTIIMWILDLLLLPKETRNLWKLNKLAKKALEVYEWKLENEKKIFEIMSIQLIIDSIETEEHRDKKNYWLYLTNLYLWMLEEWKVLES